jgi:hypothetical protein
MQFYTSGKTNFIERNGRVVTERENEIASEREKKTGAELAWKKTLLKAKISYTAKGNKTETIAKSERLSGLKEKHEREHASQGMHETLNTV